MKITDEVTTVLIEFTPEEKMGHCFERFHKSKIKRVTMCKNKHVCTLEMESYDLKVTYDLLDGPGLKSGQEVFDFLSTLIGA